MMKTRQWTAAVAAVLLCAGMTACGAKSADSAYYVDNGYRASEAMTEEVYDNAMAEEADGSYSLESKGMTSDASTASTQAAEFEDKIIRTAHIQMSSNDAQKCYETLLQFAKDNGGSELDVSKSRDNYGGYNYYTIEATLKIAPDKLEALIDLAEKTDKVTNSQVSANDVTQEYYDIKLRLDTKKAALEKYYKLLDQAKSVEESLEVQRYITDLMADIESMEGVLRYYDSKVDLSTVYLTIEQRDRLPAEVDDEFHWDSLSFSDVGKLMKNGFMRVLNGLWMIVLWLLIAVVVLSPIAVIAAAVFFLVRFIIRRKRAAKESDQAAKASDQE